MNNIKILDCTLRDGGYVNNWSFGQKTSKTIVAQLNKAKIDYIELGFITSKKASEKQTLFNSFEKIKKFIPNNIKKSNLLGMIAFGKYEIENVPDINSSLIGGIRVIFKKEYKKEALNYCKKVKDKGYRLFVNPTYVDQYSDNEFLDLLESVSSLEPYCFSLVDSMGVMRENDILRMYYLVEQNLSENIALCFHSHNNLQLSFSNAQSLMKICKKRELIIDSAVFGMGRGAGNIRTELLAQYLNNNFKSNYDLVSILKIVDECINPIFSKTPWGYSVPYYLAAINHCHPYYAKYLSQKAIAVEKIDLILSLIPNEKKTVYDKEFIEKIYLENISQIKM